MKQVKIITGRHRFIVERSLLGMVLSLNGHKLALYPLTYSIRDCLEHFCDEVGWKLAGCLYHYQCIISTEGTVTLLRSFGADTFATTFRKARRLYREGNTQY